MKNWIKSFFEKLKKKQTLLFAVIFTILVSFRVWLITGVPKMLIYGPHDDLFFARAAHFMIHRQWLGPYDHMTLIKVPFYSVFMVVSFFTGLPLYLNETLFYVGACIVLFYAFAPLIEKHWWRLLLFTLLLFIPVSLVEGMTIGVRRDFVYVSLTLYVAAFSIGLILRLGERLSTLLLWSVGLGLAMGAFMITREEGIWIYPMLFLMLLVCLLILWRGNADRKWIRLFLMILPILIWQIPGFIVSYLNYSYYGFWGTSEQLDPDFNRVMNALDRIETNDPWHPAIQIPREARMAAYEVSPLLNEMKESIESTVAAWNSMDDASMATKPEWYLSQYGNGGSEMGAHFLWLFRQVIASEGYYSTGNYPRDFYTSLAHQLETACNSGRLKCSPPQKIPFIGIIDERHYLINLWMFYDGLFHILNLDYVHMMTLDVRAWPGWPQGYDQIIGYFEQFTYNSINGPGIDASTDTQYTVNGKLDIRVRILQSKEKMMRDIFDVYKMFTRPAFTTSLIVWIALVAMSVRSGKWKDPNGVFLLVSSFVLGLLITRVMTLAIVDATTSVGGLYHYGASSYLFIYMYTFIIGYWTFYFFRKNSQVGNSKNEDIFNDWKPEYSSPDALKQSVKPN